jgi:peptidoglycan hydrolase-like protein with peptidoglycan-binding domain
VNGIYDDKTKTVVGQFQKAHNLNVDGWAGDLTAAALQSDLLAKGFR